MQPFVFGLDRIYKRLRKENIMTHMTVCEMWMKYAFKTRHKPDSCRQGQAQEFGIWT